MDKQKKRSFKEELYDQFARIGKALSSPRRLELIDLLAQGERSVQELAEESYMSVANASRHLQILREERLVRTRKKGTFVYYRMASLEVYRAWQAVRAVGEAQLADVDRVVERYLTNRDQFEAVTTEDLESRLKQEEVVVLDVRPKAEYRFGHIPGARSIPVDELEDRLTELPEEQDIVAYCRGPYCVFSDEAVQKLQAAGKKARRLSGGLPDWAAEGRPVEASCRK